MSALRPAHRRAIEVVEWCLLSAVGVGVVAALVIGLIRLVQQTF